MGYDSEGNWKIETVGEVLKDLETHFLSKLSDAGNSYSAKIVDGEVQYYIDKYDYIHVESMEVLFNHVEIFARSKFFDRFELKRSENGDGHVCVDLYVYLSFKDLDRDMVKRMLEFRDELLDVDPHVKIASLVEELDDVKKLIDEKWN